MHIGLGRNKGHNLLLKELNDSFDVTVALRNHFQQEINL
jgi:hypothetical protein